MRRVSLFARVQAKAGKEGALASRLAPGLQPASVSREEQPRQRSPAQGK